MVDIYSLRFCHNWLVPGGVPGVRYVEKLSELFYLHWERFWLGVDCNESNVTCDMFAELYKAPLLN